MTTNGKSVPASAPTSVPASTPAPASLPLSVPAVQQAAQEYLVQWAGNWQAQLVPFLNVLISDMMPILVPFGHLLLLCVNLAFLITVSAASDCEAEGASDNKNALIASFCWLVATSTLSIVDFVKSGQLKALCQGRMSFQSASDALARAGGPPATVGDAVATVLSDVKAFVATPNWFTALYAAVQTGAILCMLLLPANTSATAFSDALCNEPWQEAAGFIEAVRPTLVALTSATALSHTLETVALPWIIRAAVSIVNKGLLQPASSVHIEK